MDAMTKALQEIKFNIPEEVLHIGFKEVAFHTGLPISMDERIMQRVIRARVMHDVNQNGGKEIKVDLNRCVIKQTVFNEHVIEVPKYLTAGNSIVAPLSIVCNPGYMNTTPNNNISPMTSMASKLYNNLSTENVIQSSRLELIGENMILVDDPAITIFNGVLRCVVEHGENMEGWHPRSFPTFSKLCILAVKSYLYNHLRVKLDQGYIYSGHELGVIKEIIDSYADAEEMYQEHLKLVFKKVNYMNSSDTYSRHIKAMLGNMV